MQHIISKYIHYCQRYCHFYASGHWGPKKGQIFYRAKEGLQMSKLS